MAVYGYVRKNFPQPTTEQLKIVMSYDCQSILVEENYLKEEKELLELLEKLQPYDTLVVPSLKVFGKSLKKLTKVIIQLENKAIQLISEADNLNTAEDESFYKLFLLLSETDSSCQSKQVKQNLAIARSNGSLSGRPPIDPNLIEKIQNSYHKDKLPLRTIATNYGVSLGTVHKYTKKPYIGS